MYMQVWDGDQKKPSDPLEMELHEILSKKNLTKGVWKSN